MNLNSAERTTGRFCRLRPAGHCLVDYSPYSSDVDVVMVANWLSMRLPVLSVRQNLISMLMLHLPTKSLARRQVALILAETLLRHLACMRKDPPTSSQQSSVTSLLPVEELDCRLTVTCLEEEKNLKLGN